MNINPVKTEYELQHFNFSAEEVVAQNVQMVQALLQKSLSVFTEQLIQKQKIPDAAAERLRASCYKNACTMYDDCQPAMKKLNALYRNTFSIPNNVLLPTDLMQTHCFTEQQVETLTEQVRSAKEAVMQGAVFLASLDAESELHRELERCYEAEDEIVQMLAEFQDQDIDPDDMSDLVEQLEIAGIVATTNESERAELDKFLLQK